MRSILFTLITFLFIGTLISQDFDKARMDELFSIFDKHEQSMGSFSMFKDGKEIYWDVNGFRDMDPRLDADQNTTYRIGSISKTFTASIIMKLIENKKLKLSTPLTRFFPKIKNSSRITVELMLKHRSGIYNFTNTDEYLAYMEKPLGREELFEKVREFGSAFDPDKESGYSNSNYVLLSMIAEKVTDMSFDQIVKEMIVDPLNLQHTYVGGKISVAKNEAYSYQKIKNWEKATETDMSIPLGAGAIVSTAADINTFMHALFNNRIVSEASLEKMMVIEDGYGLGLFQVPFNEKKAFGHTGGIDGFQSVAYYFPEEKLSIAYLANGVVYPNNDLLIDALSIYFGTKKDLPSFLPVMKLSAAELDQYLGTYKSDTLPIDLTITKDGSQLIGQATGQQSFPLDAIDVHQFKFDAARLSIEFFPEEGKMILNQGGKKYNMTKQ